MHNVKRTMKTAFGKLPQIPTRIGAKILLLVHADLDGEGSAMIIEHISLNAEVRRLSTGNMSYEIGKVFIENQSANYDFIIAADVSCSEKVCKIIAKHPDSKKFIIIDHHQTADYLNKYPFGVCQSTILTNSPTTRMFRDYFKDKTTKEFLAMGLHSSGTSLMYDLAYYQGLYNTLNQNPKVTEIYRIFAHFVRCYDTWDWHTHMNDPEICENLNILYDAYGAENFSMKMLTNIHDVVKRPGYEWHDVPVYTEADLLTKDDLFVAKCEKDKAVSFVKSISKHVRTGCLLLPDENQETKYYSVAYINCNRYLQETFDMMKEQYPDTDVYIVNYGSGLSFRVVREDINIGMIVSKLWGGGGHPGAAGVKIPTEKIEDLICNEVLTGNLILNEKEGE